ncbi:MAG: RNA polymerase sigma factor [Thermoanaerobaculia bacterium]
MFDDSVGSSSRRPAAPSSDGSLLDAIRNGDRKAVARFVDLHADAVYRFIHHRLDRREALDDLVQEVFLAAWKALPRFRGESEIRTWLLGIARHKISDYYRQKLQGPHLVEGQDDDRPENRTLLPDIEERLDRQRLEARTRQVLSALPDQYRAVLMWRYWDQRSLAEMAAMTGNTEKSIERLLDRARRLFRSRWIDE